MSICLRHLVLFTLLTLIAAPTRAATATDLVAVKVTEEAIIDGRADEAFWARATAVTSRDPVAGIDITLKAAHNGEKIFLLATFADETENREHRTLTWDAAIGAYINGPEREDVLVLKWSMVSYPVGLTLRETVPYQADIWFWKAMRTDPSGYADDKMHLYRGDKMKDAIMLVSRDGTVFYLSRPGDSGDAAYHTTLYTAFKGERVPKYAQQQPGGSRADIRAKGVWRDAAWTIEFARALDTGHADDVRFTVGDRHPFAVSRYEIAGRKAEPETQQPLYGTGEVGGLLFLVFAK